MFRGLRLFISKLTPYEAIMPNRDVNYAKFAVVNITLGDSQRNLNILDVGGKFGNQSHLLSEMLLCRGAIRLPWF